MYILASSFVYAQKWHKWLIKLYYAFVKYRAIVQFLKVFL